MWAEKDIQGFLQAAQSREPVAPGEEDQQGPFDLAFAASKGEAKVIVIGSESFAIDDVAFAADLAMTSRGLTFRSRNPGNVTLLTNSLHWLDDNTEFMNIGQPIDAAVLEIASESTVKAVQALTIFAWPALALMGGGLVWWIRRR